MRSHSSLRSLQLVQTGYLRSHLTLRSRHRAHDLSVMTCSFAPRSGGGWPSSGKVGEWSLFFFAACGAFDEAAACAAGGGDFGWPCANDSGDPPCACGPVVGSNADGAAAGWGETESCEVLGELLLLPPPTELDELLWGKLANEASEDDRSVAAREAVGFACGAAGGARVSSVGATWCG